MLFALFAPLLLVMALLMVGVYAARQTHQAVGLAETALEEHKEKVDQVTADLVAGIVKEKLENYRDLVSALCAAMACAGSCRRT